MILKPDAIYVHTKSGKRYRILQLGFQVKLPDDHWHKGVMYEPVYEDFGTGSQYVRSQKDFCAKFTLERKHEQG